MIFTTAGGIPLSGITRFDTEAEYRFRSDRRPHDYDDDLWDGTEPRGFRIRNLHLCDGEWCVDTPTRSDVPLDWLEELP